MTLTAALTLLRDSLPESPAPGVPCAVDSAALHIALDVLDRLVAVTERNAVPAEQKIVDWFESLPADAQLAVAVTARAASTVTPGDAE